MQTHAQSTVLCVHTVLFSQYNSQAHIYKQFPWIIQPT